MDTWERMIYEEAELYCLFLKEEFGENEMRKTFRYTVELAQAVYPRHLADMMQVQGNLSHLLISVTDLQRDDHSYGATYTARDEQAHDLLESTYTYDEPCDGTFSRFCQVIESYHGAVIYFDGQQVTVKWQNGINRTHFEEAYIR